MCHIRISTSVDHINKLHHSEGFTSGVSPPAKSQNPEVSK
jgi:hypothetical protein